MAIFNGSADQIENNQNKTQSISPQSTAVEYPSAKAVYDELEARKTTLSGMLLKDIELEEAAVVMLDNANDGLPISRYNRIKIFINFPAPPGTTVTDYIRMQIYNGISYKSYNSLNIQMNSLYEVFGQISMEKLSNNFSVSSSYTNNVANAGAVKEISGYGKDTCRMPDANFAQISLCGVPNTQTGPVIELPAGTQIKVMGWM